ncbi:MAG: V-type ATP synthase subunit E family protein, partial [Oscillospiraceae bacterium]
RLLASSEGKKRMASERQSLISAVFDKALEALIHLPSAEYRALLISLAQSAVEDGEGGELLLNAHDRAEHGEAVLKELNARLMGDKVSRAGEVVRDVIGHVLSGKKPSAEQLLGGAADAISGRLLTLADDTAPIVGGVVVRRGRIEINCALDVIVRMLSEEAAFEVSNALFGKGE